MAQVAEPLRLFFALWPPGDLQGRLAAWARQAAGKGRAMRRENIHLTLAFLGATDPVLFPQLTERARAVRWSWALVLNPGSVYYSSTESGCARLRPRP